MGRPIGRPIFLAHAEEFRAILPRFSGSGGSVMGIVSRLRDYADSEPGEAVVADGLSLGWSEFLARVGAGASALQAVGVGPGTTVGLSIADELEHLIACLSLLCTGAWQVTLATHDTDAERAAIARSAGVTHVLVGAPSEHAVPGVVVHIWPLHGVAAGLPDVPEGGVMLRTSGTTGAANIVPLTGEQLCVQAERNVEYAGGRLLRTASIEHNNSKRHRLYCLALRGTNVLAPTAGTDVAAYCVRHGVTTLDLALMQAADLAAQPRPGLERVGIRVSGSAVPYQVRRRVEHNLTSQLYVRYGSTESGTIAVAGPGEHEVDESVGHVVPGLELEIVDEDGRRLPAGHGGHIRLRGEGVARGYLVIGEQGAARFRDGWFWPGDIGLLDDRGILRILGRADDMINLNGINIFPSEIESVLERHPAVRAAAALPLHSTNHGQIPVAAVELHADGLVQDRELLAYARELLALRAPRRIIVLDALPRNNQGKVLKRVIAERFSIRR